jgi:LysR family transcriptional regulator, nitrogen assimilation regulatory protein
MAKIARMDLRQLKYFVEIARLGSLTAAATKVFVTQSALSRQMRLLEDDVGVPLFYREARGVRLTEAGQLMLSRADSLLRDADDLRAAVAARHEEPTGRLQLGAPPSLRGLLIAPFAVHFARQFPKVTLALREGPSRDICEALLKGGADVVVVSNLESLEPFVTLPLLTEALCWVASLERGLSFERKVGMAAEPLILTSYPNSLRVIVDRALAAQGLSCQRVAEADTVSMMLDLIRRGLGCTVLPVSALQEPLTQRSISAAPIRGLSISWVIAASRERGQSLAARAAIGGWAALARERTHQGLWPSARLDRS